MSKRYTKAQSTDDALRYQQLFVDFCDAEIGTGGPDPNMGIIADESADLGVEERAWRAGCYVIPYTVVTAAGLWHYWTPDGVLEAGQDELERWVRENWRGLIIRNERRAIKSVPKFATCMLSYAEWVKRALPALLKIQEPSYEDAWESVKDNVRFFGRYATVKVLEIMRRQGVISVAMPDIRPAGAWSPRLSLSYMYPTFDLLLNRSGDTVAALDKMGPVAEGALDMLRKKLGRPVDFFTLEVLLCNFRQALESRYPGRTVDSELTYYSKALLHWGQETLESAIDFFGARKRLFPHECLGELNGWDGNRKELGETFERYGYLWSDVRFSYSKSKDDLAHPVAQPGYDKSV